MAIAFELNAEFRDDQGKGASRRLRRAGKVPAILYGGGKAPRAVTLDHTQLMLQAQNEAFFSHILNIKVGSDEQSAIVKDMQRHPAKRQIMHVDFQRVVAGQAIKMSVPLHFTGADGAPGVKVDGGVVSHLRNEVDIACLPRNLPEFLEVDCSAMVMDQMLYLADVQLPDGVEIPELAQGDEYNQPIASCHRPHKIELEEEVEAVEGELAEGEVPPEEGAEPADGGDEGEGGSGS